MNSRIYNKLTDDYKILKKIDKKYKEYCTSMIEDIYYCLMHIADRDDSSYIEKDEILNSYIMRAMADYNVLKYHYKGKDIDKRFRLSMNDYFSVEAGKKEYSKFNSKVNGIISAIVNNDIDYIVKLRIYDN